ncbi:MAG TPA: AzlC family ABC transporter permease [bacterium]|nr:AzlC family ABC transporter permease [bacterium]
MEQRNSTPLQATLVSAFKAGIPVLLGYTSIGFAFGLVLVGSGLPWWLSPLMALVVYAGAAQFMGVALLVGGAGVPEIAILTLLMNARHAVYGLSVLDRYHGSGFRKLYLIFGLTDETYGLVTTIAPPNGIEPSHFYFALTMLNQFWWLSGCTAGALFGRALPLDISGLDFAMTALFVVLLVEQTRVIKRPEPYILAAAAGICAYLILGSGNFIMVATALTGGLLLLFRTRLERAA